MAGKRKPGEDEPGGPRTGSDGKPIRRGHDINLKRDPARPPNRDDALEENK